MSDCSLFAAKAQLLSQVPKTCKDIYQNCSNFGAPAPVRATKRYFSDLDAWMFSYSLRTQTIEFQELI